MNNLKEKTYKAPYTVNACGLYLYKSNRKNAKTKDVMINHLIKTAKNKNDYKINDDRILMQFIGTISKIVLYSIQYNKHLELSCILDYGKKASYINADNELTYKLDIRTLHFERKQFYSIEQCINFIYDVYNLIYPYNTLSLDTIYNDTSIKYFIKEYYKK